MPDQLDEWAKQWFRDQLPPVAEPTGLTPKAHARLGFSGADRWMGCSGSPNACEGLPDIVTPYAREGTAAHEVAAMCLVEQRESIEFLEHQIDLGDGGPTIEVDEMMVEGVQKYLDLIDEEREYGFNPDIEMMVEHRGSLELLDPEFFAVEPIWGTCDCRLYNRRKKRLTIIDLKYGYRYVSVAKPQTRGYAVMEMLSPELMNEEIVEIELIIVQPRSPSYDGPPVRRQVISVDELMRWATEEMLPAAKRTLDPDAPRVAGDHCLFCRASPHCEENRRWAFNTALVKFSEPDVMPEPVQYPPSPSTLTADQLARILNAIPNAEAWFKGVRQYAFGLANVGIKIASDDGSIEWKLVDKQGRRRWAQDAEMTHLALAFDFGLADEEIYAQKLKSPAQIELAMKAHFGRKWRTTATNMTRKGMIERPSAGVTLVQVNEENANRKAVTGADIAMFEPLDGDDK